MSSGARQFTDLLRRPVHLLAFGLGSGLLPKAPGTAGTVAAIPVFLLLHPLPVAIYLGITVLLFAVGIAICGSAARDLGVHDHPGIVWDEWVGFLVTMTALPGSIAWIAAGFCAFRFFDVIKPWPIAWLDRRVSGGLGIMLDDLVAGMMAWVVVFAAGTWLGYL